jgi:hypothetical protein
MKCCFVRRLPQIQLQTRESLLGETVSESDVLYCDVDDAVGGVDNAIILGSVAVAVGLVDSR